MPRAADRAAGFCSLRNGRTRQYTIEAETILFPRPFAMAQSLGVDNMQAERQRLECFETGMIRVRNNKGEER